MNVRDLRQYITTLCGRETFDLLGTNKELLLIKIYGQDPSDDQVKSVISDAASFASNAEEQLFYEFVQNAYDANADSLFFYSNEQYLIILNNGEPFYTDFDLFETGNPRDGQLYNFLAKGKSLKRNDDKKLGKYGQGSKLLYTLLADASSDADDDGEDLIIDALYTRKKGPYLISWYNRNQLANLLQEKETWVPCQGDDYQNNILFAKILMSYYPIAPGTSEDYFSKEETLDAINAFDTLVDPRRNLHFLDKGTALIIPLGKGKYEKITSNDNLERVKARLGGFASITKDQDRNEGRTVDHIYVMGEEIEQHEVQSIFIESKGEKKTTYYHFAFNPEFAKNNVVNFFKGLPILDTKLKLGFILDTQKFDVTDDRQRFKMKDDTKPLLVRAFSLLVDELKKIKDKDPDKFDYVYKSLVASRVPDGEEYEYVRTAFREVFKPFFETYVPTLDGSYLTKQEVRTTSETFVFPLANIGITKYKWLDSSLKKQLQRNGVSVEDIDFLTILNDVDLSKMQSWIKSLSIEEYKQLFSVLDSYKNNEQVVDKKLFRTNKGNLYSYSELKSTENVYYPFDENMQFGECEHISELFSELDKNAYCQILFDKIKSNIEDFRCSDSLKDDAVNLLLWVSKANETYTSKIKRDICLLQNWRGSYVSFENIISERPKDTILFDNYSPKGYVPEFAKTSNWLLNPMKSKKACWLWIVRHWQEIQDNEDWGENTHRFISDIKAVYDAVPVDDSGKKDSTKLTLYLDEEGKPSNVLRAIVNNVSRLNEDEYNYLGTKVEHLRLLPFEYHKELMQDPFRVETVQSTNIINDGLSADERLLRIFIKITDAYLQLYRTQEIDGKYLITKTSSGYGYNYTDVVSPDLQAELLSVNFYRIPTKVQEILRTESGKYKFASNEAMLIKAIEKVSNPIKLLSFVKQANATVVDYFFRYMKVINIDSKITKEDLRWQVIEFAVQRTTDGYDYINKVFELLRYNSKELPASIIQQYIYVGETQYDVYLLDSDYKTDNHAIDSFLNCLPSQREIDYFKEHYYEGKEETVSVENLYEELTGIYLSLEQLKFCIDYALTNEDDCDTLEISEDVALSDALDMVLAYSFSGFDKHFKIEDTDFDKQVYANHNILLEEEYLPNELNDWLDKNPTGLNLFHGIRTKDDPFIAAREALLKNEAFESTFSFTDMDSSVKIDRTINWVITKQMDFVYASSRYKTMMAIIESLPAEYKTMPFLRYTGKVERDKENIMEPAPMFTLERYQEGGSFLSHFSWAGDQFQNRLSNSAKLARFIKDNIVYVYGDKDLLFNHGLKKKPRWNVQTSVDILDFPEHDDPVYRNWKLMKESNGITIHISKDPIIMNFNIMAANASIFADKLHDSEYGYEPGKRVVIQQPNKEGLTLMKTIAKHIANMDFFKEPFIALQALYVDQWELLQQDVNRKGDSTDSTNVDGKSNIDLSNSSLTEEQAQEAVNKLTTETAENIEQVNNITKQMNGDELEKLNDVAEPIKGLMDGLEKEDIERLANNKDKIMQMLDDIEEAEEEEKESQVRQTIGFIGELIYSQYLEHMGKDFVHAALEGIGDYDFEVKTDNLFVDVKTTLYSLKDGTAPFYLHRSQNAFMQKHPSAKYHIVRISLNDLNLEKSYKEIRDTYGKEANPFEDSHLRKRCENIAKTYWRGAKIEEFDALAPEYAIRIEQKIVKK